MVNGNTVNLSGTSGREHIDPDITRIKSAASIQSIKQEREYFPWGIILRCNKQREGVYLWMLSEVQFMVMAGTVC
jgi:hypothetical protein